MKCDVFISCKSEDYEYARKIYEFLIDRGYNVFLADAELRKGGKSLFGVVIDEALESADHLILFASKKEYISSSYVESEWRVFLEEKRAGRKQGNLITILKNIKVSQLPISLRSHQSFDYNQYEEVTNYLPIINQTQDIDKDISSKKRLVLSDKERKKIKYGRKEILICLALILIIFSAPFVVNRVGRSSKVDRINDLVFEMRGLIDSKTDIYYEQNDSLRKKIESIYSEFLDIVGYYQSLQDIPNSLELRNLYMTFENENEMFYLINYLNKYSSWETIKFNCLSKNKYLKQLSNDLNFYNFEALEETWLPTLASKSPVFSEFASNVLTYKHIEKANFYLVVDNDSIITAKLYVENLKGDDEFSPNEISEKIHESVRKELLSSSKDSYTSEELKIALSNLYIPYKVKITDYRFPILLNYLLQKKFIIQFNHLYFVSKLEQDE